MPQQSFFKIIESNSRFRLFLLKKLPAAFFSGLRVQACNAESCSVLVPYKWFTQNPFRSTYFACLAMAAEMSTGILAMAAIYGRKPGVSMLIVGMESKFYKKATGKTLFTCSDGLPIKNAVEAAVASGEGQVVKAYTKGVGEDGEMIAEFWFTWSFKAKMNR